MYDDRSSPNPYMSPVRHERGKAARLKLAADLLARAESTRRDAFTFASIYRMSDALEKTNEALKLVLDELMADQ